MPATDDYRRAWQWLSLRRRPLLLSHQRPDGDALGALTALTRTLAAEGAAPTVALFDDIAPPYEFFENLAPWTRWSDVADRTGEFDALVIVDTCSYKQLEPARGLLTDPPPTLVIDHHATADPIGGGAGDLQLTDVSAAAACVLVHELLAANDATPDAHSAAALYVGVATDCGWFRFSNTDARTLRAAADLLDLGVNANRLYRLIQEQEPPQRLALIGRVLTNLRLYADGRLAMLTVTNEDLAAVGADRTMTHDLVNEVGRLGGLELTLMLTDLDDGSVRVNLRSKECVDASQLAAEFGGGGHARAAGATIEGELAEVAPRLLHAALQALARTARDAD